MGLFGKILLFVNLILGLVVAYFSTQSWAKRQEVTSNALHYKVWLDGYPLTAPAATDPETIPFPVSLTGGYEVESVRKSFLADHEKGSDGGQVLGGRGKTIATQEEEIKEVQTKAKAALSSQNDAQRLSTLCGKLDKDRDGKPTYAPGWLSRLAETYEERVLYRILATSANAQEAAKTAESILDKKFENILAKPDPKRAEAEATSLKTAMDELKVAADKAKQDFDRAAMTMDENRIPNMLTAVRVSRAEMKNAYQKALQVWSEIGSSVARDELDRRKKIAHLLMHLDDSSPWQKRVAMIVGLKVYQRTIGEQTRRLAAMTESARIEITLDQLAFTEEYEVAKALSLERALLLTRQQARRADLQTQQQKDLDAVRQRQLQLSVRKQAFATLQAEVADLLAKQADVEQKLFEVELKVGQTLRDNFDLQDQLNTAEVKLVGGR
jgi:hypothetical protein